MGLISNKGPIQMRIKKYMIFFFLIWTMLIAFSLTNFLFENSKNRDSIAKNIARAHFNKDQAFR